MTAADVGESEEPHLAEEVRIAALTRYQVLDTPEEEDFDRLTRLAARFLGAPISLVSLIDRDRQWFKSCVGWDERETSRHISFCVHALAADEAFVVPDATRDSRFMDNPLVTGDHHIRAYAGAPLRTKEGLVLGTLCVLDRVPREFSKIEIETLTELAAVVVDELELRLALLRGQEAERRTAAALKEAKRSATARDRFLSSMSHELRTPLNAILGFAQLLQTEDLLPDQQQDVAEIKTAADALLGLIDELFAAVRATSLSD